MRLRTSATRLRVEGARHLVNEEELWIHGERAHTLLLAA